MMAKTGAECKPTDIDEGYALVRNLIFDQVHRFRRRYGGDVDELVGEANLAFVRGHEQFVGGVMKNGQPIRTEYHRHIRYWVWYELFDAMRARLSRHALVAIVPVADYGDYNLAAPAGFDAMEFADELSEDARYVAQLVLDPPVAVSRVAVAKGAQPRNFRSTIRDHLKDRGWANARINAAFGEIKETLG